MSFARHQTIRKESLFDPITLVRKAAQSLGGDEERPKLLIRRATFAKIVHDTQNFVFRSPNGVKRATRTLDTGLDEAEGV